MENPLKVPLVLSQIHLLWRFIPVDFETTNKENPEQKPIAISNETPDDADVVSAMFDSQILILSLWIF